MNCFHRLNTSYQPQTFYTNLQPTYHQPQLLTQNYPIRPATQDTTPADWIMDSEATHHVTLVVDDLHIVTPYQGNISVMVSDENLVAISHIGNKIMSSKNSCLHLHNILHVPKIPQRLMSVSRLCNDNNAFVEFHSNFFVVNDNTTKCQLLKGPMQHGLYRIPASKITHHDAAPKHSGIQHDVSTKG